MQFEQETSQRATAIRAMKTPESIPYGKKDSPIGAFFQVLLSSWQADTSDIDPLEGAFMRENPDWKWGPDPE